MKLKPPNPGKIIDFVRYHILAGQYMCIATDNLFEKGDKKMFNAYSSRAIDYARRAGENRSEGLIQKVIDGTLDWLLI